MVGDDWPNCGPEMEIVKVMKRDGEVVGRWFGSLGIRLFAKLPFFFLSLYIFFRCLVWHLAKIPGAGRMLNKKTNLPATFPLFLFFVYFSMRL